MNRPMVFLARACCYGLALLLSGAAGTHGPDRPPAPMRTGMDTAMLDSTVDRLVTRSISAGVMPGAAVAVVRHGRVVLFRGYGHIGWAAGSPRVNPDSTLYDLASLTKVISTTTIIMHLVSTGAMHLDDPVQRWVPDFQGPMKSEVTIRDLLTHTSGLPADRSMRGVRTPQKARELIVSTHLRCRPGTCFVYSDLGADVLGFAAESATGETLDRALSGILIGPMGLTHTTFRADTVRPEYLAPTGAPYGDVHDGGARVLGGVSGHAGLFSTAGDLAKIATMYLNDGQYDGKQIMPDSIIAEFTHRTFGTRALGWDTCDSVATISTCGRHWSERAFGHTGFTGTSIWMDPDRDLAVILLSNRVYDATARRPATAIKDLRADLADAAASSVTDVPARAVPRVALYRADIEHLWQTPWPRPRVTRVARRLASRNGHERLTRRIARRSR